MQDLVELVDIVSALEEGTAAKQLGQNATNRPHINYKTWKSVKQSREEEDKKTPHTGFRVALEAQHDLGRTVPSRGDVFGHVTGILLWVDREASSQTKVANLELAVCIDQQVSGLEITVQHVGRVDVLETAEDLVDEGLEMGIGQGLAGTDNGSKIAFHELCNWHMSAQGLPRASAIKRGYRSRTFV